MLITEFNNSGVGGGDEDLDSFLLIMMIISSGEEKITCFRLHNITITIMRHKSYWWVNM
jgi:hypothetical protein